MSIHLRIPSPLSALQRRLFVAVGVRVISPLTSISGDETSGGEEQWIWGALGGSLNEAHASKHYGSEAVWILRCNSGWKVDHWPPNGTMWITRVVTHPRADTPERALWFALGWAVMP